MDQDRQIRLLIAPFFLYAWIGLGALFDESNIVRDLPWMMGTGGAVALVTFITASLLPLGFLLGAINHVLLHCSFRVLRGKPYDTIQSDERFCMLWPDLKTDLERSNKHLLNASVTLDHELISDGVHTWIMRRWSAFLVSANSLLAVLLAHLLAYTFAFLLRIEQTYSWWGFTIAVFIFLLPNAIITWKGTVEMLEFQCTRPLPVPHSRSTPKNKV